MGTLSNILGGTLRKYETAEICQLFSQKALS